MRGMVTGGEAGGVGVAGTAATRKAAIHCSVASRYQSQPSLQAMTSNWSPWAAPPTMAKFVPGPARRLEDRRTSTLGG